MKACKFTETARPGNGGRWSLLYPMCFCGRVLIGRLPQQPLWGWPKLEENSDFAITGFRGKPDRGGGRGADAHREPAMSCDQMYHLSIHEYLSYS
jgi:hypothetical protein